MAHERVMVFGATGFTGGLVCDALRRQGLPFAVAGRRRESIEKVREQYGAEQAVVADPAAPRSLAGLFSGGTTVLISCAGPFLRVGWPVVAAAVEAGVHYLDTTGEQPFIRRVSEELDGLASANGCTVVCGMAMEYAVGDWAAQLAMRRAQMKRFVEVVVAYSLTGGGVSRGTALSIFEMFGRPAWSWENGRYRRRVAGFARRRIPFPFGERTCLWAPFGEIVYLARRGTVDTAATYLRMAGPVARLLSWGSRFGRPLKPFLRPLVAAWVGAQPPQPGPEQRRASRFTIVAGADGSRVVTSGSDPYGLTAEIIAAGAQRLLEGGAPQGVRSPATIGLAPRKTLSSLGVIVE